MCFEILVFHSVQSPGPVSRWRLVAREGRASAGRRRGGVALASSVTSQEPAATGAGCQPRTSPAQPGQPFTAHQLTIMTIMTDIVKMVRECRSTKRVYHVRSKDKLILGLRYIRLRTRARMSI